MSEVFWASCYVTALILRGLTSNLGRTGPD